MKNTMEALIKKTYFLLKSKGLFYVIYPSNRLGELCFQLKKYKLNPVALKCIYPFIYKKSTMIMVVAKKNYIGSMTCLAPFIFYDKYNNYSREAKELFKRGKIKW